MKNKRNLLLGLCATLLLGAAPAMATPLDLELDEPDMVISSIVAAYDATLGVLSASGFAEQILNPDGTETLLNFEAFSLTAMIDNSGNFTSGFFSVAGLLEGTLTAFGFGPDMHEFLFDVTFADAEAAAFGGGSGGIILTGPGIWDNFGIDFSNGQGSGRADIAVIAASEPGILLLQALGLTMLLLARRRRS